MRTWIAGVGMTRFGRQPEVSVGQLADEAVRLALQDSGVPADSVGLVVFSNAAGGLLTGQEMIRGQAALRRSELAGVPILNVENACASGSSALYTANLAIQAGEADVVVVVGAEKLTSPDKQRTNDAIGSAADLGTVEQLRAQVTPPDADPTVSRTLFMDVYAWLATHYAAQSGATIHDYAAVAAKNHRFGSQNPLAQFQIERTPEEVLESRTIVAPLTLLMCSPIGDGAAAVVLCSDQARNRHGRSHTVELRACALASGRQRNLDDDAAVTVAAKRAYERSGVDPLDIDVVEVHDAAAPAELIAYEETMLCAPGDGPEMIRSGTTDLGGRVPVNTSGGLLAKGHPIGATGCAQIVQLFDQLVGRAGSRQVEGARVAMAENSGGYLMNDPAAAVVSVLST